MARAHDEGTTSEFFVRLDGADSPYLEWRRMGRNLGDSGKKFSARTVDGRIWCVGSTQKIEVDCHWGLTEVAAMANCDIRNRLIWPTREVDQQNIIFWMDAWQELRRANPEIPKPPF